MTVDPAGDVYLVATNAVRVVDGTGKISLVAGNGVTGTYSDGASAPAAMLTAPATT